MRINPMKPFAISLFLSVALSVQAAEPLTMKLTETIPLPGVKGRFDHFAIDTKGHRLFVAALGNNTLEVLDIAAAKRLKSVTGLHKPQGVLYLGEHYVVDLIAGLALAEGVRALGPSAARVLAPAARAIQRLEPGAA